MDTSASGAPGAAASGTKIDALCINTIRCLSIDAVEKAKSGHPGMPLDASPMGYVLWTRFLNHSPSNPHWFNRDRFVLSAGHGSMLLYSLLHLCGYDLTIEDLKQFRQWRSRTPGHPEVGLTAGVEATTGPLGQGFANGVGMAIAEAHLAARFNRPGYPMVNHYTYGILSDGDVMEGISQEAASLAGHLRLGNLDLPLRLQPGHPVGRHFAPLLRGLGGALRSVRMAYPQRGRRKRPRRIQPRPADGAERKEPPVAHHRSYPSGLWIPAQAGHLRGARLAAWRRGSQINESKSRVARRPRLLRSRRSTGFFSRKRQAGSSGGKQME